MGCTVNGFLSIYKVNQGWGLQRSGPTDPLKENGRKFAPTAPIASKFLIREWDFLREIKYWDLRTLNIIAFTFFYKIIFWCEFNVANICNLSSLKSSTEPTSDVKGCKERLATFDSLSVQIRLEARSRMESGTIVSYLGGIWRRLEQEVGVNLRPFSLCWSVRPLRWSRQPWLTLYRERKLFTV